MGTDTPPPEFEESEPDGPGPGSEPYAGLPRYPTPDLPPTPPAGVPGPLGVISTVTTSFGLYRADALKLWQLMALVAVPVQVLVFVLRVITIPHGSVLRNATIYVHGSGGGYTLASAFGTLLAELVLFVSIGAAYRILLGRHLHHPADLRTSISFALERFASLLWVTVLVAVVTIIGFLLVIIPGIYLAVALVLAIPVLMAEDLRGWAAVTRSSRLIQGHWWHALGCIIIAGIVAGIGLAVVDVLIIPIDKAISPHSISGYLLISSALSVVVSIFLSPFSVAVPVVLYVDMLVRKSDPQLSRLLA